jgi:hypothetical protein
LDCKDPQELLKLQPTDTIDIINIAFSAHQASVVFFKKLVELTKSDNWLKNRYHIRESGLIQSKSTDKENLNEVKITQNAILFPKLIRCFSRHSEQESTEGLNLIAFVLDEFSAFKDKTKTRNADKIYNMCTTSAESRFGQKYKAFALTFPRYEDDPGEKLYKQTQEDLHIYGDRGFTWDIKDVVYKDSPTFDFEDFEVDKDGISTRVVYKIPIEFKGHFTRNPTDAKMRYMCKPPKVESPFIEYPRRIEMCISKARIPIIETQAYIDQVEVKGQIFNQIKRRIVRWNIGISQFDHIITLDLGLKNDRAALSITHKEELKLVIDFSTEWFPNREREVIVDFKDIEVFIGEVKNRIRVAGVYFDQWNSAGIIQNLRNIGLPSSDYRLTFQDYKNMLDKIYGYEVEFYMDIEKDMIQLANNKNISASQLLIKEIKELQLLKDKVDHPKEGSKDLADTIVGAVKVLFAEEQKKSVEAGEIIQENLMTEGGLTIQ